MNNTRESELKRFRSIRETRSIATEDQKIVYYVASAEKSETILLLTGGSGVSEPLFECVNHFSNTYQVITLNYPANTSMSDLAGNIKMIIEKETDSKVIVLGQSLGGMVAQVLMFHYPELIRKAILSHTTTAYSQIKNPDAITKKKKNLRLISKFPGFLLRLATASRMKPVLKQNKLPDHDFWERLFLSEMKKRSKAELIAPLHLIVDFMEQYSFTPETFASLFDKTLIIDSEADTSFSKEEKEAVQSIFPTSKRVHFIDKPHLGLITHRTEYLEIIDAFLE